jgi:hypothetical protein
MMEDFGLTTVFLHGNFYFIYQIIGIETLKYILELKEIMNLIQLWFGDFQDFNLKYQNTRNLKRGKNQAGQKMQGFPSLHLQKLKKDRELWPFILL